MTDDELIDQARRFLSIDGKCKASVRRTLATFKTVASATEAAPDEHAQVIDGIGKLLGIELPPESDVSPDCGEVAFHEETPLGTRTRVVRMRHGVPVRAVGQA